MTRRVTRTRSWVTLLLGVGNTATRRRANGPEGLEGADVSEARLALFVADLTGGGAQRRMLDLAIAFSERGHRVDVLAADPRGDLRERVVPPLRLVSLERWWMRIPGIRSKKRRRLLWSAPALLVHLRRARPAALVSTSHSVNVAASAVAPLARSGTRLVLRIDSQLSRSPDLARTRTQRRRIARARRFFPRADRIIAISRGVAEDVARVTGIPRDRIFAIHNPIVKPELFERMRAPLDHPWLAAGGPPTLLGVGRLVRQKDFATLLRAFARLRASREARLLVLGEGPERERLERLVGELGLAADVSLPGFVENPLPYMRRAAGLVLSSAWEGFGNVLVEAMACGCPVVSTDCPSGPAEILEGGAYGRLVPVGDDAALARAIEAVLDAPPDRETLRKRAQAFSVDRIVERYLEVLLGPPHSRSSE